MRHQEEEGGKGKEAEVEERRCEFEQGEGALCARSSDAAAAARTRAGMVRMYRAMRFAPLV